ncbi:MAG TPA: aminotransferase class III-fold pyridoxal phosphate-dependent enzyme [Gemmatimonadales bacterium]|nr:aminotransferase class III-fold pyridoxal phosphate-dependent enzyme [Gemmatimonadales bacterium]
MTTQQRIITVPGPKSRAMFEAEAKFLAPGTQSVALFSQLCIDRGEGAVLYDIDGNAYTDLMAGVGVASLGYAHPKYVAAMQKQVSRIHIGSFTTEHRAALVKLLADITPGDLNRTQLYSSGAEAVEAALRLAKSRTRKTEIIGFWGGFHGKTGGVLPLLGSNFKHQLGPLMPGSYSAPYASCARCVFDKTFPSCEWHCVSFLRKKIEVETTNNVAAILVEPIQGTAGNIIPPPGYIGMLRRLADEIGALLICDEMLTGFGRTGKMFAIEHEAVLPDVLTVGKGFGGGFPMSGIIAREDVAFAKPFANPSGSSSSYGGNPLAAAAARVAVETILEEHLVENARRVGDAMLAEMQQWEQEIPIVSDVRGRGLMLGMDLVVPGTRTLLDKKHTRWVFDTLLSRGVLAMIYNPEVRINPPLVIREEQALSALAIMKDVLREAAERAGR